MATKNFDEARAARAAEDRSFTIGGESFVRKVGVRPEVLADYENVDAAGSATDTLVEIDKIVLEMVEDVDDGHSRYRALRARTDDPITLLDMTDLVQWLIEEQTGRRPTPPPSPSSRSRGGTGTR
jgi:hypothetical protein